MAQIFTMEMTSKEVMQHVGGKAWRLGIASAGGLEVPPFIVIPHEWILKHHSQLRQELMRIMETCFSSEEVTLAVRSSSSAEDNLHASAAGIFESILGVKGIDALCDAVEVCLQALHSDLARKYAEQIGAAEMKMNIIIQQLISPRRAGVMITGRPQPELFMAEGAWGLATDIVSGLVNPEFVTASITDGTGRQMRPGTQTEVCVPDEEGNGVKRRLLTTEERLGPVFYPELLESLASMAQAVRQMFGNDQEVEWAEDKNGKLWLIQSRPFASPSAFRSDGES